MKTRTTLSILTALCLASPMRSFATVNVDSSDNYSGGWTNGSNGGGGFGAWSNVAVSGSGWAGNGIWNSTNAGLNLGESFGYQARGSGAYVTMSRNFSTALATGDTFSLEFGLNYDTGNPAGNKGFVLYTADNREIVVVNQSNTQNVAINGTAALTNYGTATMYWTFTQTSPTQVTVYATGRGGESEYVTRIVSTSQVSYLAGIKFYASAITNDAYAEYRQVYFDNLTLSQGAGSSGDVFTYAIANGKATITAISQTASNDLVVPATLGGYPVTAIDRGAGAFCTHIASLSFANGGIVTNIGPNAFQGCMSLQSAVLPGGLDCIAESLFYGCTNLGAVTIPSGITAIRDCAFAGCRSLNGVDLPDGLTEMGESVFLNCRNLAALDVPTGLASVPGQLCYECRGLASATIPPGATHVGYAAFYNCFGLTTLSITGAVTSIDDQAFAGCDGLTRIYFHGGVGSLGSNVFGNCRALAGAYFADHAPSLGADGGTNLFAGAEAVTVYHYSDTSGWPAVPNLWALRPTAIWGSALDQTITFPAIGTQATTNVVHLSATASSGLTVSFAVGSGPATISGGTNLTFAGTGTVSIVASQGGDGNWNPAPSVTNAFGVVAADLALVDVTTWARQSGGTNSFSAAIVTVPEDAEITVSVEGATSFDPEAQRFNFVPLSEGEDYTVVGKTVTILPDAAQAWQFYRIRALPQ